MIERVQMNDITTETLFRNLFPRSEKMIEDIASHMKQNGFDPSQPIVCWTPPGHSKKPIVIDGHTRLAAARRCNLSEICIHIKTFETEGQALAYAIHNQRDRRNMTDADLLRSIEAVDRLKQRGGDHTTEKAKASLDAIAKGKSSEETARIVGTSTRKVEKVRAILKADPEMEQAVRDGKKTINQAYNEAKANEKKTVKRDQRNLIKSFDKVRAYCVCPHCNERIYVDEMVFTHKDQVKGCLRFQKDEMKQTT